MRNVLGYLVTVVAALCWGASGVSADYLMEHHGIELTLISFFRMFVSGILTLAYVLARSRGVSARHRELVSNPRNWHSLVVYALFGLAACQITYMGVIRASNAGTATAFSALFMGTTYTGIDIVGMTLIVGAVVTISVVDLLRARRVTQ